MSGGASESDRNTDQRAAELDLREAALAAREETLVEREAALSDREHALAERMRAAHEILVAAEERDAVSDSRDTGGDTREQVLDRAHFLATGETYGDERPMRGGAALDRDHAKGDRAASRDDRIALTEGPEESEEDETGDGHP